ncbi:Uncharacterized protein Adt_41363 [Abeliophyllum distichum]|uniref:Ubiquitin-like protease family profile domain-containing protein n=1 Tax=Abeliophyllum distichum TaxID=126358 RepID=A0ABD1PNM8_9LAMI
MAKYSTKVKIRATTTDCFFGFMIMNAYHKFEADTIVLHKHSVLTSYVIGENLLLSTPWYDVDHVFFPILTPSQAHWILAQFDIKQRLLYVFNSSQRTIRGRQIEEAVEPLSKIIPHLMIRSGFWKPKSTTDKEILEKPSIQIVKDISQQENGRDCRVFVIKYLEYLLYNKLQSMHEPFNTKMAHYDLAVQLYKHGKDRRQCKHDKKKAR